ncbi:alpha/beta fold hydrolase [[Clostridium] fimetarium]|uniref:Alpha/beta hydrolase family protein n=1 Tax=[Clostridium] fimetarium TaxID=99656 RepID=A0A1I0RR42_9FIRM|nr:alpha/beta fold hydrolase [[Clostridium] fimetarium]SEW43805.1 Alpha/beta hydrolase family protein [[Clostridium] fimetarium]
MKFYKKLYFKISVIAIILVFCLTGAFFIYTANYYHATAEAVEAMTDKRIVTITYKDDMIIFSPEVDSKKVGLIFYPGAKVEYISYAPLMTKLAQKGVTCVLIKMPFNLAVFNVNAANKAINELSSITTWYISGHSLGGAMASTYAANNADKLSGIILLGAYPSSDLSKTNLKFLTMYGSNDNVLNKNKLSETKSNAPSNSLYFEIEGGNHAGYGNYGDQKGDGTATISADEQQNIVTEKIVGFIGLN